ncbi:CopD family protein [Pseudomonas boanensis]|uniref:CopD family protein n=1 Tax=Metapseudomonas boanensis TaxID=2822138 RepID=UPI0035D3ED6A
MTPHAALYAIHLLAALIWVGGMFFAWMVLRPAAIETLEPPARLKLWVEVFRRFFVWVWVAVLVLPFSGAGMLHMGYASLEAAPRYVHMMIGLYIAMLALFLRVSALLLPQLRAAVSKQDWPAGGAVLGRIRRVVGFNLLLGMMLIAIVAARPSF